MTLVVFILPVVCAPRIDNSEVIDFPHFDLIHGISVKEEGGARKYHHLVIGTE